MNKKIMFYFIFILLFFIFNCCKNNEISQRFMEYDNYGYIIYQMEYPRSYRKYYDTEKYRYFHLWTDYGIRLDSDNKRNLKNIYLYDGQNGIEYIVKNIDELEIIINEKIPSEIIIYYYEFCTMGSGIENVRNVLVEIKNILSNNNIIFAFSENSGGGLIYDPELEKKVICYCLGG